MVPVYYPEQSRSPLAGQAVLFGAWFILSFIGAVILHPDVNHHGTHTQLGLPPCPSVVFFGRPCPGCGLTTSWTHLLHGQVREAFQCHALGPILYGLFTLMAFMALYGYLKRMRFDISAKPYGQMITTFVIIFVSYGVIRFATSHYADAPRVATDFALEQMRK